MNTYRILISADDELLCPFEAESDAVAIDVLKIISTCFDDDICDFELYKLLEV